jgi:hypothetical protein
MVVVSGAWWWSGSGCVLRTLEELRVPHPSGEAGQMDMAEWPREQVQVTAWGRALPAMLKRMVMPPGACLKHARRYEF